MDEEEKITPTYFKLIYDQLTTIEDFKLIYDQLTTIEDVSLWADEQVYGQLQLLKMDVRFMKAFCSWLETWDYTTDEKSLENLRSLKVIWSKEVNGFSILTDEGEIISIQDFHSAKFELEEKIQQSKQQVEVLCENSMHSSTNLFRWSFRCKHSTSHKILTFLDSVVENLNDLVSYKAHEIVLSEKQIDTLEVKLVFLKNFQKLSANCIDSKELKEFNMFVQAFANDAACLTFLCWAKNANDKSSFEINSLFSHMLQKIKPVTPDIARLYFTTLEAIYVQQSESILFGQTALSFVDIFLEDQLYQQWRN